MANEKPTQRIRRKYAAEWAALNPTLHRGEIVFEMDTNLLKVGDGETDYTSLPYVGVPDFDGILDTTDVSDTLDKRYVTDTDLVNLSNLSGVNTGDQTITLTGDVTGSGTGSFATTLANTAVTPGPYGIASAVPTLTIDSKGRITNATETAISVPSSAINDATITAGSSVSGSNTGDQTITLTGDVTGSGTGSFAATLANTTVTPGAYGSATAVGTFTVDSKGRLTAAANSTISIPASAINNATISPGASVSGSNTGDQTITLTGDVTGSGTGSFAATIANDAVTTVKILNDAVTNAKLANISTNTFLGRVSPGNGDPENLTVSQMQTALSISKSFVSSNQSITAGGSLTLAHGLGTTPTSWGVYLRCQNANNNYSGGDFAYVMTSGQPTNKGVQIDVTSTDLIIRFGSAASTFDVLDRNTGATAAITNSQWRAVFFARTIV